MNWKAITAVFLGFVISIALPFVLLNVGILKPLGPIDFFHTGLDLFSS